MARWGEIKCPRCEMLEAKLKTSEEIGRAFEEDAGQLRAKRAKAVEALRCLVNEVKNNPSKNPNRPNIRHSVMLKARTTLAELTGGKDE